MSQRGRRGRGAGRASISREFLKRSVAEAGLDDRHLKTLTDITQPTLFPDFLWHSSGTLWDGESNTSSKKPVQVKRSTATVHTLNQQRQLWRRYDQMIVPSTMSSTDVHRYRRQNSIRKEQLPDKMILQSFSKTNRLLATDQRYFPAELLYKRNHSVTTPTTILSSLLDSESDVIPKLNVSEPVDDGKVDEDEEDTPALPEDLEEEIDDYATNHYATDDESVGDQDGEPTF